MIDITKPLELSDGTRVEFVEFGEGGYAAPYISVRLPSTILAHFLPDGTQHPAWRPNNGFTTLRNVRQPATATATATGLEHLERLEKLARRIADTAKMGAVWERSATLHQLSDEARQIVALLPEVADADLATARELIADAVAYGAGIVADPMRKLPADFRDGTCDGGDLITNTVKALKSRRELALAEGGE